MPLDSPKHPRFCRAELSRPQPRARPWSNHSTRLTSCGTSSPGDELLPGRVRSHVEPRKCGEPVLPSHARPTSARVVESKPPVENERCTVVYAQDVTSKRGANLGLRPLEPGEKSITVRVRGDRGALVLLEQLSSEERGHLIEWALEATPVPPDERRAGIAALRLAALDRYTALVTGQLRKVDLEPGGFSTSHEETDVQ